MKLKFKIMIVTFLRDLFGGCREVLSDSREAVDEIKNGSKRSDKYDSDVKALKERYRVEFETGVCIRIPLKEILEICPRERHETIEENGNLVIDERKEVCILLKIIIMAKEKIINW